MAKAQLTEFGVEVGKVLLERRMTQTELAERVGTSSNYLYLIFTGRRSGKKYEQAIREQLDMECGNSA